MVWLCAPLWLLSLPGEGKAGAVPSLQADSIGCTFYKIAAFVIFCKT